MLNHFRSKTPQNISWIAPKQDFALQSRCLQHLYVYMDYAKQKTPRLEHVGVHGGDDVVEEVGLGLEELLGAAAHHLLRLLRVLGRHPVPGLQYRASER